MESFGQPTKIVVDPKTNEAYVSDGYVNHRVVVLDADTGKFKRMWGAYGNKPDDTPVLGPLNPHRGSPNAGQPADRGAAHDPNAPPQQQFRNPVHCVVISKDDLVYVCDRQGDRLQVFTKDGKFVKEKLILPKTMNAGSVWDVALSSDPQQTFLYVADGENALIHILRRDTLEILTAFGEGGRQPGQWHGVHNIATDSQRQHLHDRDLRRKAHPEVHLQGRGTGDEARIRARPGRRPRGRPRIARGGRDSIAPTYARRPSFDGSARCRWRSSPAPCRPPPRAGADRLRRPSATRWPRGPPNSPATCSRSPRTSTAISGSARQDGLVRFDGTRFQPWAQSSSSALPARPVAALAGSSQGGVWVGFGGGGGVARIDRGGITSLFPRRRRAARRQRAPRGSARHDVGGDRSTGCSATPATAGRA